MPTHGLGLRARVPDGWFPVDPRSVDAADASQVLLRRADLDLPFTANIAVSEQLVADGERLPVFGARYRAGIEAATGTVETVREQMLSTTPPQQYAQEIRFTVDIDGRPVEVMQTQVLVAVPTDTGSAALLQILFSAQRDVYPAAMAEALEFIMSIDAEGTRESGSGRDVEGTARDTGQGAAGGGGRSEGGRAGV